MKHNLNHRPISLLCFVCYILRLTETLSINHFDEKTGNSILLENKMVRAIAFGMLQKTWAFIWGLAKFLLFMISQADLDILCSRSFPHEVNFNCRMFEQEPIIDRMICVFPLVCKMVNSKLTDRGQTRENEKGTVTEICPALTSGILTGHVPVSYWPILSLSLVTVPEVFTKVNLTQFPFFAKW